MNQSTSIIDILIERKFDAEEVIRPPQVSTRSGRKTLQLATAIIIAFQSGPILFECLARVLKDPQIAQIILIDNGSSDEDGEKMRELSATFDHIVLVQGHGNIGFSRAANLGAHLASREWLIFLNPDALLQRNCVKNLISATENEAHPCIVGARILNPDLTEQRGTRRGEITPLSVLVTATGLSRLIPPLRKKQTFLENEPLPSGPTPVPTISAVCFAVSRHDFALLRGFDSHFFVGVEDVDLCWRARQMGGLVIFHPNAEVVHERHFSLIEPVFIQWNFTRGLNYFFSKRADTLLKKLAVWAVAPLLYIATIFPSLFQNRWTYDERVLRGNKVASGETDLNNRHQVQIDLAKDFAKFPSGKFRSDGPYSAEALREDFLIPALRANKRVFLLINTHGGFASSYFNECFGKLVTKGNFDADALRSKIKFVFSEECLIYKDDIFRSISEAESARQHVDS